MNIDEEESYVDDISMSVDKFFNQKTLIKSKPIQKYKFRTRNANVYEYTIYLFNESKKDSSIDKIRKKLLTQMYEKSLLMKRNLVGINFSQVPIESNKKIYINGEILKVCGFDETQICVKYIFEFPYFDDCKFENEDSLMLTASSQYVQLKSGENFVGFPFSTAVSMPLRLLFDVFFL